MYEFYGYSHGFEVLTADETITGSFISMKVIGQNSVTLTAKTRGGCHDLPSVTIDKNDGYIQGPFRSVTKSGGTGILILYRAQQNK